MNYIHEGIQGWSQMGDQGELLKTILNYLPKDNLKIMEIGVYQGRMTAMWNVILINENINYEYIALDHFKGNVEHDNTIDYYSLTLDNLQPIIDKITIIKNNCW